MLLLMTGSTGVGVSEQLLLLRCGGLHLCSRLQPCTTCRWQAPGLRLLAAAAVAALTEKIKAMAEHMQVHRKDFSSRRWGPVAGQHGGLSCHGCNANPASSSCGLPLGQCTMRMYCLLVPYQPLT